MKFRLKRKHINKGVCTEPESCPIALAIKEKTHKPVLVYDSDTIEINGREYTVSNSEEADLVNDFISEFDDTFDLEDRKKLDTFTFTLVPVTL